MQITNPTELSQAINALDKCAKEHQNDTIGTGDIHVSNLCTDVSNFLKSHWSTLEAELEKEEMIRKYTSRE